MQSCLQLLSYIRLFVCLRTLREFFMSKYRSLRFGVQTLLDKVYLQDPRCQNSLPGDSL